MALKKTAHYLRVFVAAHNSGNIPLAFRSARKAQYWRDRFDIACADFSADFPQ
jgi:hypothetical protein